LGIVTLAGLTPQNIEVSVIDENAHKVNFDEQADLVGITTMTPTATRAYEIADGFRKRGIAVVLGGFHASAVPEEAGQHADSVVIGEAEEIWTSLLHDFELGDLKKFYQRRELASLEDLPLPRRDLLKSRSYTMFNTVETARGCPRQCCFCSVSSHFGNTYRFRPVKDVIKEVETLEGKYLFFVDDNIVGIPRRAKELFGALTHCKKKWIGQGSITFANDDGVVKLAAKSGCVAMFIGFESVSQSSLEEAGKSFNIVERYEEVIKRIHAHGISIHAAFIFGFDHDDESVFEKTVAFANRTKLDSVSFSTLTPFPGTPLYRRWIEENRILDKDWSKYGGAVFKPKLMSQEALNEGCRWAWRECYSCKSILTRLGTLKRHSFLRLCVNLGYRKWVGASRY